jgi:hypothetical protein
MPTTEAIIHIIIAIIIDFIQPILYNHLMDNSQAMPPTIAASTPLPNRKYAIVYINDPIIAVTKATLIPSFSLNSFVVINIMIVDITNPITKLIAVHAETSAIGDVLVTHIDIIVNIKMLRNICTF